MEYKVFDRTKPIGEFVEGPDDDIIVCRCEEITKGEIRRAIYDGMYTVNEVKRYIRPGMGLCQGLTCGRNVKEIIARELGRRVDLRRLPQLKFVLDNTIEYSVHISKIIREINQEDKKDQDGQDA